MSEKVSHGHAQSIGIESDFKREEKEVYEQSGRRWLILLGHMLCIFNVTLSVATCSPVSNLVLMAYDLSSIITVNVAAISFSICSVPMTFVAIEAFTRYQLSSVLRVALLVQTLGCAVRMLAIPTENWAVYLLGIMIQSATIPFFLSSQVQIVTRWFSDHQRGLATGLLSTAMVAGSMASFALSGACFQGAQTDQDVKASIKDVLWIQFAIQMVTFILYQTVLQERPESPPSATALVQSQKVDILVGLMEISKNKNMCYLSVAFACTVGLYFSLGNIMGALFDPFGYTPLNCAIIGMSLLTAGVVGSTLSGIVIDKTHAYRKSLICCLLGVIVSSILLFSIMAAERSVYLIYTFNGLLGICIVSVIPISLGYVSELTYPMEPALTTGSMFLAAQIMAAIQSLTYSAVMDVNPSDFETTEELNHMRRRYNLFLAIPMTFLAIIALFSVYMTKEDLRRLKSQQEKSQSQSDRQARQDQRECDDEFVRIKA